jgi:peptidoglycan hydrolase-like protein with peptidoglycan-binding domain
MTLEAYSSLPFSAGGAVAAAAGRGALWVMGAYMRQPLRNTAIAALIGLSAMASANALYKQAHHHPAPLFGSFASSVPAAARPARPAKPIMPLQRPGKLVIDTTETTGSLAPAAATPPPVISNDAVMALQKKLAALSFFTGTADGLFGPRTVKAIKAFELSVGRTQRGLLTQQILDLVGAAPLPNPAMSAPAATAKLAPVATLNAIVPLPTTTVQPAALSLPAPQPLLPTAANEQPADAPKMTASIDDSTGTQTLPMSDPAPVPKRVVQTIAVRAETGQPIPSQLAPAQESDDASTDPDTVAQVQRGLNSLGFLHGEIDGVAGDATAKAIRNFEVYYNFDVTGRITKQLVNLLVQNGAVI